jgi:arylsulfatase A-like enzyme
MDDIVLVSADSVRRDYVSHMPFVSDFDIATGYAGAHYTRPSLSCLISPSLESALSTQPVSPTLPEKLSELGYHCIGLAPGPQTDPAFGFADGFDEYESFYEEGDTSLQDRTSKLREYLGQFDLVRDVYRKFSPMGAVLDEIPSDPELIDRAIERFNAGKSPRFLWIHLMETHRPYGTGDQAVPVEIDRRSESLGGNSLFSTRSLTEKEHKVIEQKYQDALSRTGKEIERLMQGLDSDPTFVFCSDHGEELGEDGYYYHQGYRRRVVDRIVKVPVVLHGLDVETDRTSLMDIAPTLVADAGGQSPTVWDGRNLLEESVDWAITIAPWHEQATVRWTDFETSLVCRDADVSLRSDGASVSVGRAEVSDDIEERLRNLGYRDAG